MRAEVEVMVVRLLLQPIHGSVASQQPQASPGTTLKVILLQTGCGNGAVVVEGAVDVKEAAAYRTGRAGA